MANCKNCAGTCIKAGFQKLRIQKWLCKNCNKYQQIEYAYQSYNTDNEQIKAFVKEGLGIRSMSRLLRISCTTIIKRIRAIAAPLKPPILYKPKSIYEMDEMHTFIQHKRNDCWISYAIDRFSKRVIDFRLGGRTKSKLKPVIESILYRLPKRIYTDGLSLYKNIIPTKKHRISPYGTNRIERCSLACLTTARNTLINNMLWSKLQFCSSGFADIRNAYQDTVPGISVVVETHCMRLCQVTSL